MLLHKSPAPGGGCRLVPASRRVLQSQEGCREDGVARHCRTAQQRCSERSQQWCRAPEVRMRKRRRDPKVTSREEARHRLAAAAQARIRSRDEGAWLAHGVWPKPDPGCSSLVTHSLIKTVLKCCRLFGAPPYTATFLGM